MCEENHKMELTVFWTLAVKNCHVVNTSTDVVSVQLKNEAEGSRIKLHLGKSKVGYVHI